MNGFVRLMPRMSQYGNLVLSSKNISRILCEGSIRLALVN